ncbi:MAG: threonine-phosphate decarboxylase CobD [Bacillota bacterium]
MDYKHGGNIYNKDLNFDEIIDFSSNINPLGYPNKLLNNLESSIKEISNYPDPNYISLRKKLSKKYKVNYENLIVGNGGIQLIHNTIEFLDFKKALIVSPTFVEYEKALVRFNKKFDYFELKDKYDFEFNYKKLLKDKRLDNIDLVIICNPNNPTGNLILKEKLEKLLAKLNKKNINLMLDEAFIDFVDEKFSLINLIDNYDNLIILRSLTKFYAIPGMRLGFLLTTNNDLLNKIKKYRESWSVNIFAKDFGKNMIFDKEYEKRSKKYIDRQRKLMFNEFKKLSQIKVYRSYANYLFFKLNKNLNLKDKLIKEKILIRSCKNYKGLTNKYYRVAVKTEKENKKLLNKIKKILGEKNNE